MSSLEMLRHALAWLRSLVLELFRAPPRLYVPVRRDGLCAAKVLWNRAVARAGPIRR